MLSGKFYLQFFHCCLLAVLILICYSNTFNSSWHFDDIPNIVQNKNIHLSELSWESVSKSLRSPNSGKISRPVTYFTFALNYLVSGKRTVTYHLVNIAIHFACAVFVYLIFQVTLELYDKTRTAKIEFFSAQDIALLGAVLWAIHPIQTQAVTYIVQRMASLSALFYLASFYCYIRCRLAGTATDRLVLLGVALVLWVAGILSKENAVMLPLVLMAYEAAFFQTSLTRHKRFVIFVLLMFVAVALVGFLFMRGNILEYLNYLYAYRPFTMWERVITQPVVLVRYIMLLLCPVADFLTLESDLVASKGLLSPPVTLLACLFISTLAIISILLLKKYPILSFGLVFYFINHIIESSFIGLEIYFEHRNYLPSIFIYFSISYLFIMVFSYYNSRKRLFMYRFMVFAVTFVLCAEANATYIRNDVWRDSITILEDSILHSPENIRPYISLGAVHSGRGNSVAAKEWLKKAEALYKKFPDRYQNNWIALLYYNAGIVEVKMKNEGKAVQHFYKSLKFNNKDFDTHINLGHMLFKHGDYDNAEISLFNAIGLRDDTSDVFNLYGRILYEQDKFDEAITVFQEGLRRDEHPEMRLNLVATYIATNNLQRARSELYKFKINNSDIAYLMYVGYLYPGNERKQSAEHIAKVLLSNNIIYCEWINEIKSNKFPGIIYPDISEFEPLLRAQYLKLKKDQILKEDEIYINIDKCLIGSDLKVTNSTHGPDNK